MLKKYQSGFTLVELAVVVVIIGIMATAGLAALNSQLASANISVTKKKQETIKEALITYLGKNKRLPCPAIDNTGNESRIATNTPANCTGYFGLLPYAELNLPKSVALDGWDNFFSYAVSRQWTLTYSASIPVAGGKSSNVSADAFNVTDAGVLSVFDRPIAANAATTLVVTAAVFVVSHGKNVLGAFTTNGTQSILPVSGSDEFSNVVNPLTWALPTALYQREYTDTDVPTYGAFDDVVQSISSDDLVFPLLKNGSLKTNAALQAQWEDQQAIIKSAVIGYLISSTNSNCDAPNSSQFATILSANGIPSTNPWGDSIVGLNYVQNFCSLRNDGRVRAGNSCVTTTNTLPAYTITTVNGGIITGPTNAELWGTSTFNSLIQSNC